MHTQNKSTAAGHTQEGHAPGPWAADWETGHIVSPAIKESGKIVCTFPGTNAEGYRYANARLIAAAPELLEALDWALGVITSPNRVMDSRALHQARAAIARAKGQ